MTYDDTSAPQKPVKAEDFIVFQEVALLPLVDINEDETTTTGTLVITKYELVFADEKVKTEFLNTFLAVWLTLLFE